MFVVQFQKRSGEGVKTKARTDKCPKTSDVVTHWNSTFLVFQCLLEQRWVVYGVCMMNVARKGNIDTYT